MVTKLGAIALAEACAITHRASAAASTVITVPNVNTKQCWDKSLEWTWIDV